MKTMGSHSHLVHQGIYMRQDTATTSTVDYGTLNLTTGAFTKIAASPVGVRRFVGRMGQQRLLRWHQQRQYLEFWHGEFCGANDVLGTGLNFGGAGAEKLMFAPNGNLYGFDVDYGGGSGAWGTINPATGAFTQIGNLNTYFPGGR